ncbi:MAG: DJ-1/PfpI family protein [Thermoanaerobaculia bacterium]
MKRLASVSALALFAALRLQAIGPKESGPKNLAILIFPGVQIIDYTGPWEVFGHAFVDDQRAFRIYTVAPSTGALTTSMGMSVNPEFTLGNAPRPDVLVVPGGNVSPQLENAELVNWVRSSAKNAEVVLSVCNGAFFLAKAGLLDGLEATTFAGLIDELKVAAPKTRVVTDKRFVDNGKIVTAAGLTSGIDGALHVIEKLYGKGTAQVAAVGMEYDWRPDSGFARAALADRHLDPAYEALNAYRGRVLSHAGSREKWETTFSIETGAAPSAVLAKLDAALSSRKDWVRETGPARKSASAESRWRVRDAAGASWIEVTRVEPSGETGALRVVLSITRAS